MRGRNLLNGQHEVVELVMAVTPLFDCAVTVILKVPVGVEGGWPRTVIVVVVERIAGRSSERGDQANQRHQRQTAQPACASSSPGKTAKPQHARQQNGPCNGAVRDVQAAQALTFR